MCGQHCCSVPNQYRTCNAIVFVLNSSSIHPDIGNPSVFWFPSCFSQGAWNLAGVFLLWHKHRRLGGHVDEVKTIRRCIRTKVRASAKPSSTFPSTLFEGSNQSSKEARTHIRTYTNKNMHGMYVFAHKSASSLHVTGRRALQLVIARVTRSGSNAYSVPAWRSEGKSQHMRQAASSSPPAAAPPPASIVGTSPGDTTHGQSDDSNAPSSRHMAAPSMTVIEFRSPKKTLAEQNGVRATHSPHSVRESPASTRSSKTSAFHPRFRPEL